MVSDLENTDDCGHHRAVGSRSPIHTPRHGHLATPGEKLLGSPSVTPATRGSGSESPASSDKEDFADAAMGFDRDYEYESTEYKRLTMKNTFIDVDDGDAHPLPLRPRSCSDWSGMRQLEAKGGFEGLDRSLASLKLPECEKPHADASLTQLTDYADWADNCGNDGYFYGEAAQMTHSVPVICWLDTDETGFPTITPCPDQGAVAVQLCATGETYSAAELACAPKAPTKGSHVPFWPSDDFPDIQPTTLLLSNLPHELTQEALIEVLDKEEFSGFYDFVFMPVDLYSGLNYGHATVNLTRHAYSLSLAAKLHGRSTWGVELHALLQQRCHVSWSHEAQGFAALVERYRNEAQNHHSVPEGLRPQIFSSGWPVPFPQSDADILASTLGAHAM